MRKWQPSYLFSPKYQATSQRGQVGVIIILIMVVLLTIGISIATRTVTQQKISIEQEESTKVFNAAETAVEKALNDIFEAERDNTILDGETVTVEGTQYTVSTSEILNMQIQESKSVAIPTTETAGIVTIDWEFEQDATCNDDSPALLVTIFSESAGEISARYLAYDPCYSERGNDFEDPDGVAPEGWNYRQEINLTSNDTELHITPLYGSTRLEISGTNIQTGQYSVASRSQDLRSAKAINVSRSIPSAPSFMNYALFSGGSIAKN